MSEHICPWWIGYFLINPLRRFAQDPKEILSPYVSQGMTVLEPGPGMGFFTLELARLVGSSGRVVAVDVQREMLEKLKRRAAKRGLLERIEARLVKKESMALGDLRGRVDFALAFAMVHEMPAAAPLFREVSEALKPGASLLLAEPRGHVKTAQFEVELKAAAEAGLATAELPSIRKSHAALLRKVQTSGAGVPRQRSNENVAFIPPLPLYRNQPRWQRDPGLNTIPSYPFCRQLRIRTYPSRTQ